MLVPVPALLMELWRLPVKEPVRPSEKLARVSRELMKRFDALRRFRVLSARSKRLRRGGG